MSKLFDRFETDATLEKKGVKITYDDVWFYLAKAGGANSGFKNAMRDRLDRAGGVRVPNAEAEETILKRTFVEHCILGWGSEKHGDGVMEDKDGSPIPFSKAAALEFLNRLDTLFADLMNLSRNDQLYLAKLADQDAKNSAAPSSGS